jgi:transposase-like protein
MLGAGSSRTTQKTKGGFEYVFVAINKFTKWIKYKLLVKYSIAKAVEFIQDIMHRFGIPNRVITDLGSPFTAIASLKIGHKTAASI